MLKSLTRRMLFGMVSMWGRVFVASCVVAACSGEDRQGQPRPGPSRPDKPDVNNVRVGEIAIANECVFIEEPGDAKLGANVLVRGQYKRPDGTPFENLTVYELMCQEKDNWTCRGTMLDLGSPDHPAERVLGFMAFTSISGAKAESVRNGLTIISWGVHTITVDTKNGTFEHRDTSGSGKASCVTTLGKHYNGE